MRATFGALGPGTWLVVLGVEFSEGPPEHYFMPLCVIDESRPDVPERAVICRMEQPGEVGRLCDALIDEAACRSLLRAIADRRQIQTASGRFVAEPTSAFADTAGPALADLPVVTSKAEQSNSAVIYGDRFILKVFRKLESGQNPDVEIGRFLTEQTTFANVPRTTGVIRHERRETGPATVGLLQQLVRNDGTGWEHALDVLRSFYQRLDAEPDLLPPADVTGRSLLMVAEATPPPEVTRLIADYLPFAVQLGRRTAELHLALASNATDPDFAPEPLGTDDLATLSSEIREQVNSALATLRARLDRLDAETVRWHVGCSRRGQHSTASSTTSAVSATRPRRSASTAITTSARSCVPATTSSCSTLKANPPRTWRNGVRSTRR